MNTNIIRVVITVVLLAFSMGFVGNASAEVAVVVGGPGGYNYRHHHHHHHVVYRNGYRNFDR